MKAIPDEFVPSLCKSLRQVRIGIETAMKMPEEQIINLLASMEENKYVRDMMKSRAMDEVIADSEVQAAVLGLKEMMTADLEVIDKTLQILESDLAEN